MNFRSTVARQKREISAQYAALAKLFPAAFCNGKPVVATLVIKPPAIKEKA